MERVDLVSVALIWCVGLTALIQAINARGHFRIAMSWIIAAVIFAIALFFSSMKALDLRNLFSAEGPVQSVLAQPPPPHGGLRLDSGHRPPNTTTQGPVDEDSLAKAYRSEAARLLKEARSCAESVQGFRIEGNLETLSAPKYEKEESRARALRNQSSNLHRQGRNLRSPAHWLNFHEDLLTALESLRLAGYEIHAQFSADEDVSSSDLRAQSARHAKQALASLADAEARLEKLDR